MALHKASGEIQITADGSQIKQELDRVKRKHRELKKELGALQKKAGIAFGVMTAATAGLFKAYGTFQRAQRGLTNDIKQMGATTNVTAIQVTNLASKLQDTLNISDDVGIRTASTLLRSGKLAASQLEAATVAAANIAATYGKDIGSVTEQLSQVFANPIEGLTQLKSIAKSTVTEVEMEMVRSLVEQGKMASAHSFLLDKIAETTAGAAAARADDLLGVFENISNSIGDIIKFAGKQIWDDWGFAFRALRDWLIQIKDTESGVSKVLGKVVSFGVAISAMVGILTTVKLGTLAWAAAMRGLSVATLVAANGWRIFWGAATLGATVLLTFLPDILDYLKDFRILDKAKILGINGNCQ